MLFRKKLISNFIWILAMIVLIVMGAQYAFLYGIDFLFAGDDNFFAQWTSESYMALDIALLIWIVIFMGLVVGIYYSGRALSGLIRRKIKSKPHVANIICILAVCITFITAILVRGFSLLSSGTLILKDTAYFDAAAGVLDGTADISGFTVHGASYAYIMILYFLMTFLGGRAVAAVLLQVIIQMLTIILVFSTYKCFVNYASALTATLILAVSPLYTAKLLVADPGCFTALIAVGAIYLVSCLLRTSGGNFKTALGAVLGLVAGYLLYLDVSVIIFLIPWLFAFIYEAIDKNRHGFILAYVFMFCFTIIGFVISLAINGTMLFGSFGEAFGAWMSVTGTGIVPEHALLDADAGFSGLLQCLIMVGIASMTIMGTVGREYIEYELPWVMMIAAALTPMTKWGYLRDNTLALVVYVLLVGAGMSAMVSARTKKVTIRVGGEEEPVSPDSDNEAPENVDLFAQAVKNAKQAENERIQTAAESVDADDDIIYENIDDDYPEDEEDYDQTLQPDEELSFTELDGNDLQDEKPVKKDQAGIKKPESKQVTEEMPAEELPTSISWASIKALDDDLPDLLEPEEEEDDEAPVNAGGEEDQDTDTVLSSAGREYNVVIPGADFAMEEVYEPGEDEGEPEEAALGFEGAAEDVTENEPVINNAYHQPETGSVNSAAYGQPDAATEYDPETMQVDYMPGMIPNPLPLPPKKKHVGMSYDREFDFDDDYNIIPDNFGYKADNDPDFDDLDGKDGFMLQGEYDDPGNPDGYDDYGDPGSADGYDDYGDPGSADGFDDYGDIGSADGFGDYDENGSDGFDSDEESDFYEPGSGYDEYDTDLEFDDDMEEGDFDDYDDNAGFDEYDDGDDDLF